MKNRPKGLVYKKHKENPTSFKKGLTPWNKGLVGMQTAWNKGVNWELRKLNALTN